MAWFLGQSIVFIVLSFLLGLLVGWLIWGRRWRTDEAQTAGTAAREPALASSRSATPEVAAASEPAGSAATEVASEPAPASVPESVSARESVLESESALESEAAVESGSARESVLESVSAGESVLESVSASEPSAAPDAEPATEPEPDVEPSLEPDLEPSLEPEPAGEPEVEPVEEEPEPAEEEAEPSIVEEPLPVVAESTVDDLERIEGVGPKLAAALRAAGLRTYAAVADADVATLEQAIEDAGVRFAPSLRTWSRQARLLADGDEEGFQALIGRLVAGREVAPATTAAPSSAAAEEPTAEPLADEGVASDEAVAEEPTAELDAATDEPGAVAAEERVAELAGATDEPGAFDEAAVAEEPAVVEEAHAEQAIGADEAVVAVGAEGLESELKSAVGDTEVVLVANSAPVRDDDLQRIEGIGPRMSGALVAAGIRTYQQLAGADEATIRAAIEAAGLRFAPSLTTWARQARLLAEGDEAGFADLTRRLVAGRDVGRV